MASKLYSAKVSIGGTVSSSFKRAFGGATDAVRGLGLEVKKLAKQRSDIKAFTDASKKVDELRKKLADAKTEAKKAADALAAAEKPTAKLTRAADAANRKVSSLEKSIEGQVGALGKLTLKLNQAGMKTADLERHDAKLERRIKSVTAALRRREAAQANFSNAKGRMQSWMGRGLAVGAAAAAFAPAVGASNQFEDMMVDVGKYVDGLGDPGKLKAFGEQIREIGRNSPIGAKGIGDLVIGAGKLGMAAPEAIEFAKAMEIMSAGLDLSSEEAADMLTKIKSGMKLSIPEVLKLGDAMNFLGDVTAADSKRIVEIMQRQGSVIKATTKLTAEEIAALAAAFDIAAPNAETAATAMKNFTSSLTKGKAASKGNEWAYGQLKLSPEAVAKGMIDDPKKTIALVLERLGKVPEADRGAILSKLFGEESKGAISNVITNYEGLVKSFKDVGDESNFLGRSAEEQARNFEKWSVQSALLRSKVTDLGISIGDVVKESLNPLLKKLNPMLDKFDEWRKANPKTFATIVKLAAGAVALAGAIVGIGVAVAGIKLAFAGWAVISAKVGIVAASGLAPVAAAVAAIGIAALTIRKYWEPLKAFFSGVWQGITEGWQSAGGPALWEEIKTSFRTAKAVVDDFLKPLGLTTDQFTECFENGRTFGEWVGITLASILKTIIHPLDSFREAWPELATTIEDAFNRMTNVAQPFFDLLETGMSRVNKFTGKTIFSEGVSSDLLKGYQMQKSGPRPPGFNPAVPFKAPPVNGKQTGQINIQIHSQPGQSEEGIARAALRLMKQEQERAARGSHWDGSSMAFG